jgi:hypothetical protein
MINSLSRVKMTPNKLYKIQRDNFKVVFIYKSVYWDNTAWYWIYLINNGDIEYKVHYATDGFISIDDEVHKLNGSEKDLEDLKAHSRILIEENDIGSLDMNWFIHLTLTGKISLKIDFDIWKWSPRWETTHLEWFQEKWIIMEYTITPID